MLRNAWPDSSARRDVDWGERRRGDGEVYKHLYDTWLDCLANTRLSSLTPDPATDRLEILLHWVRPIHVR
jgi:hypothetical protein